MQSKATSNISGMILTGRGVLNSRWADSYLRKFRKVTLLNLDDLFRGMLREGVRRSYGEDARVAVDQQRPFEQAGALVVQEVLLPAALHQLRNYHPNLPRGLLLLQLPNV